jgi:hypothetical protein
VRSTRLAAHPRTRSVVLDDDDDDDDDDDERESRSVDARIKD